MKAGLNLLNFASWGNPRVLQKLAEGAEGLGYHFLMISDHVAVTPDVASRYPAPFYDPFVTLAWLSGMTKKLELGTSVIIVPYRHPLQIAKLGANIDQLSGGRFIFGAGIGWAQQEFATLGVPFRKRGKLTDEYLKIIIDFWTKDVISHDGDSMKFENVQTGPRPLRSPRPPIWIGGMSDAALQRTVRFGDAWHPLQFRMDWLKNEGLPRLQKVAKTEGAPLPRLCPRIMMTITGNPLPEEQRLAGEGTIEQVRKDFQELQAIGAEYVLLDTYKGKPESMPDPDVALRTLGVLSREILDLQKQSLR
ncbi:MAG TPA: TIGR03619 family F420-dependent LLM class oxidoreductase [Candidatus Bathyarchaeia archaeon]|jgi:probable F420-dependent oxidoreductase|nr:TIGR03619 family F420-dependent LLM class oxidoreductase [Candidatus Bathyarchaeia archaeon]